MHFAICIGFATKDKKKKKTLSRPRLKKGAFARLFGEHRGRTWVRRHRTSGVSDFIFSFFLPLLAIFLAPSAKD